MKGIFLLFSVFHFTFCNFSYITYDNQYFYCDKKIYSDNNALNINELEALCEKIKKNDRFIILVTNSVQDLSHEQYTEAAEYFYYAFCDNNKEKCSNSFAICIFLTDKNGNKGRIRIISGKNSKTMVKSEDRQKVINKMIEELRNRQYFPALDIAVEELSKYYSGSSFTFGKFILYIVLPIIIICGAVYYYKKKQSNELPNNQALNMSLVSANANHYPNYSAQDNNIPINCILIHNHINYLKDLINQIHYSSPPIISIESCLICTKELKMNESKVIEMSDMTPTPGSSVVGAPEPVHFTSITRFGCLHAYHADCLKRVNLDVCMICSHQNEKAGQIIPNNYNSQVLDENQIREFIGNISVLYNVNDLNEYIRRYPDEFNSMNNSFNNQLIYSWKVSV